ncbi:nuclear transport factor 2 family protein [Streptomyces sp. NPDC047737]|uniref:nuclear transport factor 2 family protein n=1 Tax=Streptomyces sp. NPDC047737 TaxID=3155740 RepID=UPI0034095E25
MSAREKIVEVQHAYMEAMEEGDTDAIAGLLGSGFTLTHMTGYVQPKAEWLAQMSQGQFVYHSIEEKNVALDITGDRARLVARTVTDATVYGARANWRLQLATDYAREGDVWVPLRTVATTW